MLFSNFEKNEKVSKLSSIYSVIGDYSYDFYGLKFRQAAEVLIEQNKFDELIELLSEFLTNHPLERRTTFKVLNSVHLNFGKPKVFNELAKIYVETTEAVAEIGGKVFGLPPCFEEYWALSRVGELVNQASLVHLKNKLAPEEPRPVLALPKGSRIANAGFVPYLQDVFDVVVDPAESQHIHENRHLSPYSSFFYKYSESEYGPNYRFISSAYKDLRKKKIRLESFQLKDQTIEIAKNFLKSYGIKETDQFVVLHLREAGFVAHEGHHRLRNTKPLDFIPAISWLLEQGLKVVRIGHPKMTELPKMSGLIDLAYKPRPGEVDIYLCGKAEFYYGSLSGPEAFATNFGTRVLSVGNNCYGLNAPKSMQQLIPFYDPVEKKVLSVQDIKNRELDHTTAPLPFSNRGLVPQPLDSSSHLRAVKDMIELIEGGKICKANQEMKARNNCQEMLSCFTTDSLALYD